MNRSYAVAVTLSISTLFAACSADVPPATEPGSAYRATGPGTQGITPVEIAVPDETLVDLRARLERTRLPDQIPGTDWEYGTERAYLEQFLAYWNATYDWRAQEARLNELDHFRADVDGLGVHFVHARSTHEDATPLLLIHGWPGSFFEFVDLVRPLTQPEAHGGDPADAFHVVIPSLPGYGLSDKPAERGYNPERIADVLAALMEVIGYDRYGVQGGDWGGIIGRSLAGNYADRVIGFHTNFPLAGPPRGGDPWSDVSVAERAFQEERTAAFADGRGYQEIQGTKPQTLGYALNDSPAGLAAWIVEKFHGWSDHSGDVAEAFTRDELLTNIMLYWVTGTITSSTRIYYESRNTPSSRPVAYVEVPTAAAVFPEEIMVTTRAWAESRYNIVRWTVMPSGGHFAALEEPDLLMDDLRAFFRTLD